MTWFFHRKVVDWRLIWAHQGLSVKVIKSLLVNIRAPSVMSWKINSFYPEMWTCTVYVSTVKLFGLHTDLSDCVRLCTYITMSPKFCFFFSSVHNCYFTSLSVFCWAADSVYWCDARPLHIFVAQVRFKDTPTQRQTKAICCVLRHSISYRDELRAKSFWHYMPLLET